MAHLEGGLNDSEMIEGREKTAEEKRARDKDR